ncbi:limb-bud and heart, isoform CRA_a, partial [Mus musculus]
DDRGDDERSIHGRDWSQPPQGWPFLSGIGTICEARDSQKPHAGFRVHLGDQTPWETSDVRWDKHFFCPPSTAKQIFPDPSDFDRCCKLKDRLPSIVVEPTEGEVESGELRWPPEEFLVQEDEQDNCEETTNEKKDQ